MSSSAAPRDMPRQNPFARPSDQFFPNGQRKRLFDSLRHLSQWSRRALLVTGGAGSGKTTLCTHLAAALGKDSAMAILSGDRTVHQREMFVALCAELGVEHPADAPVKLLSDLVRDFVAVQNEQERLCVILVDDAHKFEVGALEALLALSADCRVRLIFFGEPGLTKLIDQATARIEIACHETLLLPLSAADTRSYVEWRVRQAGVRQAPAFNDEQLAVLYELSDGLPGAIDHHAGELFQSSRAVDSERMASEPLFPRTHFWLLAGLLAALALAYWWVDGVAGPDHDVSADAAVADSLTPVPDDPPVPEVAAAREVAEAEESADPAAAPELTQRAAPEQRAGGEQAPREARSVTQSQSQSPAEPASAVETVPAASEPVTAPVPVIDPQLTVLAAAEPVAGADEAVERTARGAAPAEQAPVVEPTPVPVLVPEPEPKPLPAARNAAGQIAAAVNGVHDSRWLLSQDGDHFTVQLITLGSAGGMIGYLRNQPDNGDFAVYTRTAGGKTLYIATYGVFPSRAAAERASRALPGTVGRIKPWVRPLREVQRTIRG